MEFKAIMIAMIFLVPIGVSGQERSAQYRRDSLSKTSAIHICVGDNVYLVDSLFNIDDAKFGRLMKRLPAGSAVRLVKTSRDSAYFYISTRRSFIVNNVVLKEPKPRMLLQCETFRIKKVSPEILAKKYGIQNSKGGFLIRCK